MEKLKVLFRERKFLNKLGYHSGAFIFAEITKEFWTTTNSKTKKKKLRVHRYCNLSIADCSRIINLDLDLDTVNSARNSLSKLDLLIKILQNYRTAFGKEFEALQAEQHNKHKKTHGVDTSPLEL